jgi:uncharacterized membrane protein
MWWLSRRRFARSFDAEAVRREIATAEAGTTGEIVVSLAPFFLGSVPAAARRTFARLGIANTSERNGVLLFIVPSRRQLYLLGDDGVCQRVPQAFWDRVAGEVSLRLARAENTGALRDAVQAIGQELARHYPASPPATAPRKNQLPDQPDV